MKKILEKKKVIIVGGGFAGINLAMELNPKLFDVYIIDKLNHHQFQPLFYQVAASQLDPSSISFPLRYVFKGSPYVQVRMSKVTGVDPSSKKIFTNSIGELSYDYLVLAMGCDSNFFGNAIIKENTLPLKTTFEAIRVRNHVLSMFEKMVTADSNERESIMNLVVVGGGATGVELAGSFAEMKSYILPKDYHNVDLSGIRIILIEGSENTLNNMSDMSRKHSRAYLEKLGVEVKVSTVVKNYDGENLELNNGSVIKTKTVIWTAGVIANTIDGIPKECMTRGNRVIVDRFSAIVGLDGIFALGDIAYMETPKYPKGHPQLASVAIKQARFLGKNLNATLKNKPLTPFVYKNRGTMATIGKNKAVVDLPFLKFHGFWAWAVWMFLHLMLILSVKNRVIIFINWVQAYFTKNSGLRLILKNPDKEKV